MASRIHEPNSAWPKAPGRWLTLAAAPVLGAMTVVSALDASAAALCTGRPDSPWPIDGMTWMYLLMTLFHLPPWLALAVRRTAAFRFRPLLANGDQA